MDDNEYFEAKEVDFNLEWREILKNKFKYQMPAEIIEDPEYEGIKTFISITGELYTCNKNAAEIFEKILKQTFN